jgi:hypothetical protein
MPKLAAVLAVALLTLVAASSATADTSFEAVAFVTTPGALSDIGLDLIVSSAPPVAKVVIYVPQGYGLNAATPAGTTVGTIDATAEAGGSSLSIPTGNIVADDPAKYTALPQAQACAAGTHAGVWVAQPANFKIPIYVDPTSGAETALGAYKLQVCLSSPADPTSPAPGVRLTEAELDFSRTVFTNPSARNLYVWRVLVTPYVAGTVMPNPAGTFELRGDVFIPASLTLKKKSFNKKTKRAVLTGKLTVVGIPVGGVPVGIFSISSTGANLVARTRTNKKGNYTVKLKVKKTMTLQAYVPSGTGACDSTPASPAPAGCTSETSTEIFGNLLRVAAK